MTQRIYRRGFTIVELLIVIVVIGILATVGVLAYGGITSRATDNAVLSDLETLASLQTDYALKNDVGGKSWYSETGVDPELEFAPSSGNVIDIVTNQTDYCIRVYNPASSKYKTLYSAAEKGSSANSCGALVASAQAEIDSPPSFQTLTWTQQNSLGAGNWRVGDISGDGATMIAASQTQGTRLSKNAGASWTTVTSPSSDPQSAAISLDGNTVVLSSYPVSFNNIYVSVNGGTSFTGRTTGGLCCGENVAVSGDGTAIIAIDDYGNISADGGYVYVSTDAGTTWSTKTALGIDYWRSAAASEDGTYMVVGSTGGRLFTSSNSGATWTQRTLGASESFEDAAVSSDGQTMYLASFSGKIFKSTNAGVSWTHLTSAGNRDWYSLDASADGSKIVAGVVFGRIYTSTDSGATWQENSPAVDGTWSDVGISSSGARLIAADSLAGGVIWTGRFQ